MSSADTFVIDPLTVTVSSLSCCLFFILVALLLVLIYRRDPFCCRTASSRTTNEPPHYHSRDALVGFGLHDDRIMNCDDFDHNQLPRGPFVIGKPSDYHLPGAAPRLPSYESVRRKDRRTLIHHMISERFSLRTSSRGDWEPPPPSYAESLHQPLHVPSLGLGRLDEHGVPAQDQDGRSSNRDHSASPEHPEPHLPTSQDRRV
ncbi:uncharacterized protein LOC130371455 isoform X1 [Gadus chalcogrammus]|uniref:uncharacterized protein LOC130371455 isoform X1 n=1 Tax=Gadus chalcogrammus TaxID=1042646 RepID=UPI0024C4B8D9|nr:uncharacterized protein LOC130371455 isoform X1 [Gadus chalcogrammus]